MKTKVTFLVRYWEIRKYLLENGHTKREAEMVIAQLRKLDTPIKKLFITWFQTGNYPCESIEDTTVRELVECAKMTPVNAFLTLDWLKREPVLAKAALCTALYRIEFAPKDTAADEESHEREPETIQSDAPNENDIYIEDDEA